MRKTENKLEKKVGIKYYTSSQDGVNGKLKKTPEDFIVNEISSNNQTDYDPDKFEEYEQTSFKIKAKNWETNNLIREISNQLGVSKNRIGFSGTKDKRAITEQTMTIYNIRKKQLEKLDIKNVEISNIGLTNERNDLGNLIGNEFTIKIQDIKNKENIPKITETLNKKGVINYFGIQRFGSKRPNTHIVGEKIVRDKPKKAVKQYVAKTHPNEPKHTKKARQELWDKWEEQPYLEGLKKLPKHLRYERAMLDHLHTHQNDYIGALRKLPHNLLQMFIHSYQSYLYHKMINERIKQNLPLNKCLEGDVVCYTDLETDIPNRYATERVEPHNQQKIQEMIDVNKAFITAPLIGIQTKRAFGKMGKIEDKILKQEKIKPKDFKIKNMPELTSKGLRREITLKTKIKTKIKENTLTLNFFLPKGSYATLITREYMKNGYNP
ncbi:tRNA pseudouridine(13) synthase TruD [Methanonatronarchaeum sp. AMET-Sl]|uniref:tRNA pseudouridine(13) synthase TruD n=1 Tax=Methanonatronarchaeum sp. AMET-Sl TaxID=3037654 RepID=UPI00244E1E53|nr:tRNA pseudouridine(13) synthase TruD [Methanonatronarchaeum sp. AMET-Sl]WGI17013.1 tRNA pseudouridine(13) synthase TruD [Methanonatronarchaeum sp. AMET-Sl]